MGANNPPNAIVCEVFLGRRDRRRLHMARCSEDTQAAQELLSASGVFPREGSLHAASMCIHCMERSFDECLTPIERPAWPIRFNRR